jgi:hypothetical protein
MARRSKQGQSMTTIDKERRIAAALSVGMRIANARFGGKGYRYFYFDANCGSGWNHQVDVPGSPLVFWHVMQECAPDLEPAAYFCDRDVIAMEQLRSRFSADPATAGSILLPGDNEDGLHQFADAIRRSGEVAKYAIGAVLIDPNGYFYRNAGGIGAPVRALRWFVAEFPRIDIILNLNMRTYFLQRGQHHQVIPPGDVLASLRKRHWLVSRAGGQSRHLLAVGRNMETGDHKSMGFHFADSMQGQQILSVDADGMSEPDLFGDVA